MLDFEEIRNEIVAEISSIFMNEFASLKNIIMSQNKHIQKLTEEIRSIKNVKNLIKEPADNRSGKISERTEHPGDSSPSDAPPAPMLLHVPGTSGCSHLDSPRQIDESNRNLPLDNEESYAWRVVSKNKRMKKGTKKVPDETLKASIISPTKVKILPKKSSKPLVGTQKTNTLNVVPKIKFSHLHVTRLSPDTTVDELKNYFQQHKQDVTCEKLNSKQPEVYSSFKVTLPAEVLDIVLNPEFWPVGVAVNRFFPKRRQQVLVS